MMESIDSDNVRHIQHGTKAMEDESPVEALNPAYITPDSYDPMRLDNGNHGNHAKQDQAKNGERSESDETSALDRRNDGTSSFATIMHIIKGNVGTGILAMPNAFSNAGILVGPVVLVALGIICTHCMHLLVNCAQDLCRRTGETSLSYSDVGERSFRLNSPKLRRFSKIAGRVVDVFLVMTVFGGCCVYLLFVSENIQTVVMKLSGNLQRPMQVQLYELCLLALIIPFVFITNLKLLAKFSLVANIAATIGIGIILYDILIANGLKSVSRLQMFKSWSTLPIYFGTAIYAFEGIGMVLPLENQMKEPQALPRLFGVLDIGMTIVCVLYLAVGFYGYIEYGDGVSGSITLNLTGWYGIVVQLMTSVGVFVSYGLQFYVIMETIGDSLASTWPSRKLGKKWFDYLLRVAIVLASYAIAASVDRYLDLLISLVGAFSSTALAVIFPPTLELINLWPHRQEKKYFNLILLKDVLIIALGLVGLVSGTIVTIGQLITQLSGHGSSNSCPPS